MCGFPEAPRYSCTRLRFGFSYLPWHTTFFVLALEHARPVVSPADILTLHSCLLQQEGIRRQQLLLAATSAQTPTRYGVPVPVPLMVYPRPWHLINLIISPRVPLLFFHIPFQWAEPKRDVLHQVLRMKVEDYFPSAGKDFMNAFGHTQQVKLGKQFPLAFSGESDPCILWICWGPLTCPKEPGAPYPPFAISCRMGTAFALGEAEGFREQFYVRPWNSTGGGWGSTERFGKAWQTPSAVMVSMIFIHHHHRPRPGRCPALLRIPGRRGSERLPPQKGDVRPHQVAAEQIAGKRSSIACTLALNIYVFSYCPFTARVTLFGERKGCWPLVTALI